MLLHTTVQTTTSNDGETVLTQVTDQPGQESSVEITQNTKGEPRVTVKVYHPDIEEAERQALEIYLRLSVTLASYS